MSIKRRASTELNHENWDQEEKDKEEMGSFKTASEDVLEKRVIRTAKRRSQIGNDTVKPVFSGFGGFNKTQPSSFDFLANLTNGNKPSTSSPATTSNATPSPVSKPLGTMSSSSIFSSTMSSSLPKSTFGNVGSESSSVFGASTSAATATVFTASRADSTVNDNPFKIDPTPNLSSNNTKPPEVSNSQVSSTIFGIASSNSNFNKSLFTSNTSTPLQKKQDSSISSQSPITNATSKIENKHEETNSNPEKVNTGKLTYYSKLKGLNESVSEWIKKHVDATPLCILSPIFKDYERYLKEIQDEYEKSKKENESEDKVQLETKSNEPSSVKSPLLSSNNLNATSSVNTSSSSPKSIFAIQNTASSDKSGNFSFGFTSSPSTTTKSAGFKFGVSSTQSTNTTTSPFAMSNSTTNTNDKAPFSFGSEKPFSFNSNIQVKPESNDNNDDEEEPPKVEFTPVVEDNSVFDKRCKIFVKKDGNFVDKGIGTLYIKKIPDSDKHQLLVRANTNLGNVLLNLVLSSTIPTQRMGKNNVMMVCIPSPDSKPPPVPILIRVKTSEEADDLLNTLNKYKG